MNDNDYFSIDAMNASTIKAGARSMLHMQHYIDNPPKETSAMRTGTQRHMAVLEPERFESAYTIYAGDRRKKEYKELKAEVGEANIMTVEEHNDCVIAADRVRNNHIVISEGLLECGDAEKVFLWDEEEGRAKCKIDYFIPNRCFVEYKTTRNLDKFLYTARDLHYDLGLGWYWRGCRLPGVIIAQESMAPFDVAVFEVPEHMHRHWFVTCQMIWRKYIEGDRSGAYTEKVFFELNNDDEYIDLEG